MSTFEEKSQKRKKEIADRIAALFGRLASDYENEVLASVSALKKFLLSEGLSFGDLVTMVKNWNVLIEDRKYSDADAKTIFDRGVEVGRSEGARGQAQIAPADYYDVDGHPRWNAIAMFCQQNNQRLGSREQEFVDKMAGSTMWQEPSERQAKWLLSIFIKLGGRRAA